MPQTDSFLSSSATTNLLSTRQHFAHPPPPSGKSDMGKGKIKSKKNYLTIL